MIDIGVGTILVLYNAGPLDVSWAVDSDKVVAILESFFPAQVRVTVTLIALHIILINPILCYLH